MIRVHRTRRCVERSNIARRIDRQTDLRQSKVQNLGVTTLCDEDVRRLDVAVDDAFGMRGIEGIGNLDGERENQFRFQRTPSDAMLQRHAVEILHDDEVLTFALVNLEDHADVGVVQCRCRLGFALEAAESVRIFSNFIRQELERDKATKFDILGLVYHTHPATAELLDDAIVRDGLADHWRESYVCKTGKSMKGVGLVASQ